MHIQGQTARTFYRATYAISTRMKRECATCGGLVRRSWRTKILHRDCFGCRYLKMIYGPNISVTRSVQ